MCLVSARVPSDVLSSPFGSSERAGQAGQAGLPPARAYDVGVIHLEAPTHRLDDDDRTEGPVLRASGETYEARPQAINAQVPEGHRLTWIRRVDSVES